MWLLLEVGLANGLAPCYADDHYPGHHTWNYLLAWRDCSESDRLRLRVHCEHLAKEAQAWLSGIKDDGVSGKLYLWHWIRVGVFKLFRDNRWLPQARSSHCKCWRAVKSRRMRLIDHIWWVPIRRYYLKQIMTKVSWAGASRNRWLLWIYSSCGWWCLP